MFSIIKVGGIWVDKHIDEELMTEEDIANPGEDLVGSLKKTAGEARDTNHNHMPNGKLEYRGRWFEPERHSFGPDILRPELFAG